MQWFVNGLKTAGRIGGGIGIIMLTPLMTPALTPVTRPVLKAAIKGGLIFYGKGRLVVAGSLRGMEGFAAEFKEGMGKAQTALNQIVPEKDQTTPAAPGKSAAPRKAEKSAADKDESRSADDWIVRGY